jgi:hypothetical protein
MWCWWGTVLIVWGYFGTCRLVRDCEGPRRVKFPFWQAKPGSCLPTQSAQPGQMPFVFALWVLCIGQLSFNTSVQQKSFVKTIGVIVMRSAASRLHDNATSEIHMQTRVQTSVHTWFVLDYTTGTKTVIHEPFGRTPEFRYEEILKILSFHLRLHFPVVSFLHILRLTFVCISNLSQCVMHLPPFSSSLIWSSF